MRSYVRLQSVLCLGLLSALGGCTQFYTGGLGMKTEDRKAAEAYADFKNERLAKSQPDKPAFPQDGKPQIEFDHEPAVPQDFNPFLDMRGATPPAYNRDIEQKSLGALGLYGQIDRKPEPYSSPMDGIDNIHRVTIADEGADFDPDIDSTGRFMVYASTRHRERADIYIKRIGATAITQLTTDPANDVMPVFSPDGQQVAFASDRGGNWDIYLMDVRGGQAMQLTNDPTDEIHPSFSHDGSKLVYSSFSSTSGQWEMVIVDVANPATRKYVGHGLFPTWSPTEDKVLFQRARERGTRWFSVWTMEIVDGDAGPMTEIAASANAAVITPDWSPDGKRVVFCTVIDPGADEHIRPAQADVWVMNADGTGRARLTGGRFANLQPAWSPEGSVFFVSDRSADGVDNVWAMRPDRAIQVAQHEADKQKNAMAQQQTSEQTGQQGNDTSVMVPTE